MKPDFPCICGHFKDKHPGFFEYTAFCDTCWKMSDDIIASDKMCMAFVPDNLKYLENLSGPPTISNIPL